MSPQCPAPAHPQPRCQQQPSAAMLTLLLCLATASGQCRAQNGARKSQDEFSGMINQVPRSQAGCRPASVPVLVGAARPWGRLSGSGWLRAMNLTAGGQRETTTQCPAPFNPRAPGPIPGQYKPQGWTRQWPCPPFPSPRSDGGLAAPRRLSPQAGQCVGGPG